MMTQASTVLSRAQRQGWFMVLFGFFGFITWAALFPIDQGVPASGFLVSQSGKVSVVSHLTGMVVQAQKKPGDPVAQGDLLFEFDTQSLRANERGAHESIKGLEASSLSLREALNARLEQIQSLEKQYETYEKLLDSGFSSRNALLQLDNQLSLAKSEAYQVKSTLDQNQSRKLELLENIKAIQHEITKYKIFSPSSGVVMNLAIKGPGVNVTTGTPLLEIAPKDETMIIAVRIPVDFATRVTTGLMVDVMFPTLPGSSTLRIQGVLRYLAADQITDPKTGEIYLEGHVSLDATNEIQGRNLRAGLPAAILINTGSRTLLSYIVRPFSERLARGIQ
jgi:multidrug resistance efflux pump